MLQMLINTDPYAPPAGARAGGSRGVGQSVMNFYTDDSPGIKIQPVSAVTMEGVQLSRCSGAVVPAADRRGALLSAAAAAAAAAVRCCCCCCPLPPLPSEPSACLTAPMYARCG